MIADASSLLERTMAILDGAEVPEALRSVAFGKVFDLLAGGGGRLPSQSTPTFLGRSGSADGGEGGAPELIATRLGVTADVVEQAYFVDGDTLEVVLPPSKLDVKKSRATEQIALLVAAGRQAAGLDDDGWTSVDPIRVACEHFKRHDPSNFATTIKDMSELLTVRGSGRERKVKMTAPAWQRASELIVELTTQG
jgi:hypothetical protein